MNRVSVQVSVAKQSADAADSKFRKATEDHLKERASLRNSIDKVHTFIHPCIIPTRLFHSCFKYLLEVRPVNAISCTLIKLLSTVL